MAGEGIKIYIALLYVNSLMDKSLSPVYKNFNSVRMANSGGLGDWIDQTENVGDLCHAEKLGLRREKSLELIDFKMSVLIYT